jgi:hypothetical protein
MESLAPACGIVRGLLIGALMWAPLIYVVAR